MRARTEVEVAAGDVENDWDFTLRFEGLEMAFEAPYALGCAFEATIRDDICNMPQRRLILGMGLRRRHASA